jgi:hypothetical protein
LKILLATY